MGANARTILFAVVLGVVCSAMLATVSGFTAPYRAANEKVEEVRNILDALDVRIAPGMDAKEILEIFDRDMKKVPMGTLTVYEYTPSGSSRPDGVVIPFVGAGLWGPVSGVLALEPDLVTIRGVRFYKQEETPGLGGEISSAWFQNQFSGKKIVLPGGKPGILVLKPQSSTDEHSVEGITGASMTSDRVQTMLNQVAGIVDEERKR